MNPFLKEIITASVEFLFTFLMSFACLVLVIWIITTPEFESDFKLVIGSLAFGAFSLAFKQLITKDWSKEG